MGYIFNEAIDKHFLESDFYKDTMNPRFLNSPDYDKLTIDLPTLARCFVLGDQYTLTIYMNKIEVYGEIQTPWRSFSASTYLKFEQEPESIEEIIETLNEVLSGHELDGEAELRSLGSEEFSLDNGDVLKLVSDYEGIFLILNNTNKVSIEGDTYELLKRDLGNLKKV